MPENNQNIDELQQVASVLSQLNSPENVLAFMNELLTPSEQRNVALRWRLLTLLSEGVPQRRIADELGISLCKITRGSKVLKAPNSIARSPLSPTRAAPSHHDDSQPLKN